MICNTTIIIPGQQYVKVEHNSEKDETLSKGFYHIHCFRNRLNGTQTLQKLQNEALDFIQRAKEIPGIKYEVGVVT